MEETIGYESFFSTEEWDAIQSDNYTDILEEAELEFGSVSPQGQPVETKHEIKVYKTERGFEIECELCGEVGFADDEELVGVLKRFHKGLGAMVTKALAR